MEIISFFERDQRSVIKKILRHCGLWEGPIRTLANPREPPAGNQQAPDEPRELQLICRGRDKGGVESCHLIPADAQS